MDFFLPARFDTKHASALQFLLEAAEYDVPPRLGEIALADPSRQMSAPRRFCSPRVLQVCSKRLKTL